MNMPRYRDDPRLANARFAGRCRCGAEIHQGDRIAYLPATRTTLGGACGCADRAMREFEAARFDEEMSGNASL
jgi:hypothetical protein